MMPVPEHLDVRSPSPIPVLLLLPCRVMEQVPPLPLVDWLLSLTPHSGVPVLVHPPV